MTTPDDPRAPEAALRRFLERIDPAHPRLVVRHADEGRIVPHAVADPPAPGDDRPRDGYAVRRVTYITVTARLRDADDPTRPSAPGQARIDGLSARDARDIIEQYPVLALFRSDHIT